MDSLASCSEGQRPPDRHLSKIIAFVEDLQCAAGSLRLCCQTAQAT